MSKFNNIKVVVKNYDEVVFKGTLNNYFIYQDGGELQDVLDVVEACIPLITGEKKIVTMEYETMGIFTVEKIN